MNLKYRLAVSILVGLLTTSAHAGAKILPDACGNDAVKFDVKTEKGQPAPAPPEEGKAQIVFIAAIPSGTIVRYGIDGSWAGANKGDSYFSVSIAPGEHHLCAANLKSFMFPAGFLGTGSMTAEAGKVYYFEFKVTAVGGGGGGGVVAGGPSAGQPVVGGGGGGSVSADLIMVTEDEGKYRVKTFPVSTFTPKK